MQLDTKANEVDVQPLWGKLWVTGTDTPGTNFKESVTLKLFTFTETFLTVSHLLPPFLSVFCVKRVFVSLCVYPSCVHKDVCAFKNAGRYIRFIPFRELLPDFSYLFICVGMCSSSISNSKTQPKYEPHPEQPA